MSPASLISALAGTQPKPQVVVEDQSAKDIIARMMVKHVKCMPDYDKIYAQFDKGDLYDTCYGLWEFCRKNFKYVIEDEDRQNVSSPITMLKGVKVDCKNYSLFIAGILDAMKRHGKKLNWEYRFASYKLLQDPGHVFVVVNPNTDDIWVDPVLDEFNEHLFYWHAINKKPRLRKADTISGMTVGIAKAVQDYLDQAKDYTEGIVNAVNLSTSTVSINSITQSILSTASLAVPGATEALSLIKSGQVLLNDAFGVGSPAARLYSNATKFGLLGVLVGLFTGRTYQSDQYALGVYYKFYVMNQNVTDNNHVADGDVWPATKWFIDRLGVFVSGAEHINALIKSPQDYMKLHDVNAYTTTDPVRVAAASQVAQRYFTNPGNYDSYMQGAWADTQGVFDNQLVQIALASGKSVEQVAAQTGNQYAQDYLNQNNPSSSTQIIPGVSNTTLIVAAGAALLGFAILD